MVVLLPIAFLAGVITAVSPCVLPVLPIVLAGGASGGGRRPPPPPPAPPPRFAATLIVPQLAHVLERPLLFLTRRRAGETGSGFVLGLSLGLVFVPCGGPVL